MANVVYNIAKGNLLNDLLDTDIASGAVFKVLLIEGTTAPDPDHDTVAAVLAAAAELTATGYGDGPGGAGRITLNFTVTVDDTNNRADAVTDALTPGWTGLDNGAIDQFLIYRHTSGTDDSLNIPVACIDTATGLPLTLNGSDVNLAAQTIRLT